MEGGVDSGFVPSLIRENEIAWAINTSVRGGFIKPRPGFKFRRLSFPDAETRANATAGLYQGAGTYITDTERAFLAYSVAGRIYAIDIDDFTVADISIAGNLNSPTKTHAWFQQAENTLVVQNKTNAPFLWNGTSARRSVVKNEVPVGGPMAYLKGRLWVAMGNKFYGGDLVNSYPTLGRESVLKFLENTFLHEGGSFSAAKPITGMAVGANINTALGDGDLLVFTRNTVYAFNAPANRDLWKDLRYPIERVALLHAGALSAESVVVMNSDLMFRSNNGINSFRYAQNDFAEWGNTAISRQVERALKYDTDRRLSECSAVNFDNRMLMTVQPEWVPGHGMVHRGLVALDYHMVSGIGRKTAPAWEGVWTGLRILRVITVEHRGVIRCFVFALDDSNRINLWELTKDNRFDIDSDGLDVRIPWIPETKSFTYGKPRQIKKLHSLELWYDRLTGALDVDFFFRPNLMDCWTPWNAWSACSKYKSCETPDEGECQTVQYLRQQVRPRMALPQPPDTVDVQTGGLRNQGYEFQFRLQLLGYARLTRLVTTAKEIGDPGFGDMRNVTCVETPAGACDTNDCKSLVCCDPDDFGYAIATAAALTGYITGRVFDRVVAEPTSYAIWSGRVGLDAAGTWISDDASLQAPQFLIWGGEETGKLTMVTQTSIGGDFIFTSVIGGALSEYTPGQAAIAVGTLPWGSAFLVVQQFNSITQGKPESVDFTFTTNIRCFARAENLTASAQLVTIGMQANVNFQFPSTTAILSLPDQITQNVNVAAYDGVPDDAGPSGFIIDPPLSHHATQLVNVDDSSPDWASLIGNASVHFPAIATQNAIATMVPGPSGGGNIAESNTDQVGCSIDATWHYHPLEGYWIFCIADEAPWSPTSFTLSDSTTLAMADVADLGGIAGNRGEINGFGYELVTALDGITIFKLYRSKYYVPAGGDTVTVTGTAAPLGSSDTGLGGVQVKLYNGDTATGTARATAVTAGTGFYGFTNLPAGHFLVVATLPTGYTCNLDVDTVVDSPLTPTDVVNADPDDCSIPVTLASGETDSGNNFYLEAE